MDVIDNLSGKWTLVPNGVENVEKFCLATIANEETKQKLMCLNGMVLELSRDGETITSVVHNGQETQTLQFKLGETVTSNTNGLTYANIFKVEGDALVGEHIVVGAKTYSRRFLEDGKCISELEFSGTKMRYVLSKS